MHRIYARTLFMSSRLATPRGGISGARKPAFCARRSFCACAQPTAAPPQLCDVIKSRWCIRYLGAPTFTGTVKRSPCECFGNVTASQSHQTLRGHVMLWCHLTSREHVTSRDERTPHCHVTSRCALVSRYSW